jgi:hypothetical protein
VGLLLLAAGYCAPHGERRNALECDHVASAWLVARGWVPYRDMETDRPPFALLFAAPIIRISGYPAEGARAALLLFYALALAAIFRAQRESLRPFGALLFAIVAALGHPLYSGHLFLPDNFAAFALVVLFVFFLRSAEGKALEAIDWILISFFTFAAVGTLVEAIYPAGALLIGIAGNRYRFGRRRRRLDRAVGATALLVAPFALLLVYFAATYALGPFWDQLALITPKQFINERASDAIAWIGSALIFRRGGAEGVFVWTNLLFLAVRSTRFSGASSSKGPLKWVLRTGRFDALVACTYFAALLLARAGGHSALYFISSFWAAAWAVEPAFEAAAREWRAFRNGAPFSPASHFDAVRVAGAALLVAVLAGAYQAGVSREEAPDPPEIDLARVAADLTLPGEPILALPASSEVYYLANRAPAAPSPSYLPWLDPAGRAHSQLVSRLQSQRAKVVVLDFWSSPLGPIGMRVFSPELRDAFLRNYQPISAANPSLFGRVSSIDELVGRYDRIERAAVIDVPEQDARSIPVHNRGAITQRFTLARAVRDPKIEILVSGPVDGDARVECMFGSIENGRERVWARDPFRAGRIEPYNGAIPKFRRTLRLAGIERLAAGRYFFRLVSRAEPNAALLVWTAPAQPGMGAFAAGDEAVSRTVCFRLTGASDRAARGNHPIVEQALARAAYLGHAFEQTATIPEATTLSAVSILAGGQGGRAGEPYSVSIRKGNTRIAERTFARPAAEREWTTIAFDPIRCERGEVLRFTILAADPTTAPIELWTAATDVYAGGRLAIDQRDCADDLCFKLYARSPQSTAGPDVAILAVDFETTPPLGGADSSVRQTALMPKDVIPLDVQIENRGTSITGPFWVEFFAVPLDLSGPPGFLVDSLPIVNLAPGERRNQQIERAVYALGDGEYSLLVIADRLNMVYESDEENNRFAPAGKTLRVANRPATANLYIGGFGVTGLRFRRGCKIDFTGLIANNGARPCGRFTIEFWLARDANDHDGRIPACDPIAVESLAPYEIFDLSDYPRNLREAIPAGRYCIGCTVDARDAVFETSELDNAAAVGPRLIEP